MPLDPSLILAAGDIPANSQKAYSNAFNQSQNEINAPYKTQALQNQAQEGQVANQTNQFKLASAKLDALQSAAINLTPENWSIQKNLLESHDIPTNGMPDQFDANWKAGTINQLNAAKQQLDLQSTQADIAMKQAHAQFFANGGQQPAAVKIANALQEARAAGDMGRVNNLLQAQKVLDKGLQLNDEGLVESIPGYNTSLGNQKTAETEAKAIGTQSGEADKTLSVMQSNLPSVLQRFKEMRDASANASYGLGTNKEGEGIYQQFAKSALGDDQTSQANALLAQRSAQGILPELGPQLAQAGVRGNKFLETIANSASGLDLGAKPKDKIALINGLENTYINNLKSTAQQLRAKGRPAPSDSDIDQMISDIRKGNIPEGLSTPIQNQGNIPPQGLSNTVMQDASPGTSNAAFIQQNGGQPVSNPNASAFAQKVQAARAHGYSDSEIKAFLAGQK